jgi:hypothetical protein
MGITRREKLLIGVAAMFWSIWFCCNDVAFTFHPIPSILQVLFSGTYRFRFWRLLQKKEAHKKRFLWYVNLVAMEIFAGHGWRSNARLEDA